MSIPAAGAHRLQTQFAAIPAADLRVQILVEAAAIANLATDLAAGDVDTGAKIATEINATRTAINAILAALRATGVVATA